MKYLSIKGLPLVLSLIAGAGLATADDSIRVPGRLLAGVRDTKEAARILSAHRLTIRRDLRPLSTIAIDAPPETADSTLAALRSSGAFDYVEPDYYAHTAADPNDPSYASQWHLRRIGGPMAWSLSTGSESVTVAVIDSGVFPHHPDLAGKLVPGWNLVKDNADTSDVLGHGTAVAGTVAAATNNGLGVAGVNWGSRVMPLVAVDESDYAAYSDIAAAIQYAADHGVRIINVSIGGPNSSNTLQKAVDYAWSKNALVFASAMNQGVAQPYYPAACTHAVAVAASDANDRLASFSNFGTWITLAAPGTGILSTANGGGYSYWNGTSFASPIAAGVAALILSVNPALSNAEVLSILKNTADRPGDVPDAYFGSGRVNAYRAVLEAEPVRVRPVPPFVPGHTRPVSRLH